MLYLDNIYGQPLKIYVDGHSVWHPQFIFMDFVKDFTHTKKSCKVLYIHTCCHLHGNLEEMHADEKSPLTEVALFSLAPWNILKKEQNNPIKL